MTYVAFLRAVNVAGHATVRMADVCRAFEAAGGRQVTTCIQSGNIIFETPPAKLRAVLETARARLRKTMGEEPLIIVRTLDEIEALVRTSPFSEYDVSARIKFYVAFLTRKPRSVPPLPIVAPKDALEAIAVENREAFIVSRLQPNGFFGFPNNFIEEALGVSATTRNWSTITRIVALAGRLHGSNDRASIRRS